MRFWPPWKRPERGPGLPGDDAPAARDLARAARILSVRTRREVAGAFAGSYTSAFRGGGIEFEESRPYVPGDDVRYLDWNAMARTGEPFVKHFREERDEMVLLALDVSASMRFGTSGRSKASTAAHAVALLAAAAGAAGDRVGLMCFDDGIRAELKPARGAAQTRKVIETAVTSAQRSTGGTELAAAIDGILGLARQRAVAMLFSDFRGAGASVTAGTGGGTHSRGRLRRLSRLHDVVCVVLHDPREESLPRAGLVRVQDPEEPGHTLLVDSSSARTRARFRRAWALRAASLERGLRATGADVVWMRTDRDPLGTLTHFFHSRALGRRSAA